MGRKGFSGLRAQCQGHCFLLQSLQACNFVFQGIILSLLEELAILLYFESLLHHDHYSLLTDGLIKCQNGQDY